MSSEQCDVCTGDMLVARGAIFKKENRWTHEPCILHAAVVKELECCGISHFWLCFERCRRRFDFWSLILSLLRCPVTITVLYLVGRTDRIGASGDCFLVRLLLLVEWSMWSAVCAARKFQGKVARTPRKLASPSPSPDFPVPSARNYRRCGAQRFHTRCDLQESREIVEKLKFFFLKLSKEEKNFHFFTGISMQTFLDVLAILGDSVHSMMYSADVSDDHEGKQRSQRSRALSVEDELLMTLVELRHDFPESDLAARFGISQPTVSRIFSAWIRCMYHAFREIDIWPSRSLVDTLMPDSFRQKYPSTRVIIDATEFHIEKPAYPDVQASTWSSYKNINTLKLLVGLTPSAVISFLFSLWGGRISDKELTKRSKLLEKLERGDSMMADRGFDIGSITPEGTNVIIPPFLGGRPQFEADELVVNRRIASLRIHVEQAMERIKNFHITHFIPANFCPLAQPIVHICAFLTIFLSPLVPTPLHPSMIRFASPASSALACVAVASTSPLACRQAVASGPESTALSSISPADQLPVTGSSTTLPVPEGVPQLQAPRLPAPQSLSSGERPTQHDGVCLQCARAEPPLLRVCKTCERRYHHMCQSMDEEGRLCDHCFVRRWHFFLFSSLLWNRMRCSFPIRCSLNMHGEFQSCYILSICTACICVLSWHVIDGIILFL